MSNYIYDITQLREELVHDLTGRAEIWVAAMGVTAQLAIAERLEMLVGKMGHLIEELHTDRLEHISGSLGKIAEELRAANNISYQGRP